MSDNKEVEKAKSAEEDPETKGMVDVDPNTVEECRDAKPAPTTILLTENSNKPRKDKND